jgi:ATP adenylyltransferase
MMSSFVLLKDFIGRKMRMSHIYQPLMLKTLLENRGRASAGRIAKAILVNDESQLEYYEQITHNMVGRVLRSHNLVSREKEQYRLEGFDALTKQEIDELKRLCDERIELYVEQRGERIWAHRGKAAGYLSGTLKFEVLKRAQFRCELCGISADEKALEVDHIRPRNHGGTDDAENLQALCYSCNAMKRDRDATDFRPWRAQYELRHEGCVFCEVPASRVIAENRLAYAIRDGFPVTPLHTLVIPKRHVLDYFALTRPEVNACHQLIETLKTEIEQADSTVAGFNLGINAGEAAGQTIFHCHIHLIPRRSGDTPNPRGGVRHVVEGKGSY